MSQCLFRKMLNTAEPTKLVIEYLVYLDTFEAFFICCCCIDFIVFMYRDEIQL